MINLYTVEVKFLTVAINLIITISFSVFIYSNLHIFRKLTVHYCTYCILYVPVTRATKKVGGETSSDKNKFDTEQINKSLSESSLPNKVSVTYITLYST